MCDCSNSTCSCTETLIIDNEVKLVKNGNISFRNDMLSLSNVNISVSDYIFKSISMNENDIYTIDDKYKVVFINSSTNSGCNSSSNCGFSDLVSTSSNTCNTSNFNTHSPRIDSNICTTNGNNFDTNTNFEFNISQYTRYNLDIKKGYLNVSETFTPNPVFTISTDNVNGIYSSNAFAIISSNTLFYKDSSEYPSPHLDNLYPTDKDFLMYFKVHDNSTFIIVYDIDDLVYKLIDVSENVSELNQFKAHNLTIIESAELINEIEYENTNAFHPNSNLDVEFKVDNYIDIEKDFSPSVIEITNFFFLENAYFNGYIKSLKNDQQLNIMLMK